STVPREWSMDVAPRFCPCRGLRLAAGKQTIKVADGVGEPRAQVCGGTPTQPLRSQCYVGLALPGIIRRKGEVVELGFVAQHLDYQFGQLAYRDFRGVAKIDGARKVRRAFHESDEARY